MRIYLLPILLLFSLPINAQPNSPLVSNTDSFPGYTHQWAERIDQLYYKGKGLKNISTQIIHSAFGGFPSDHYLIVSKFVLADK